jgi:glycyl-tRNA synthetase beta chain
MRKLGAVISDELLISKEKVELSASICKTDLLSDCVGEFPELQGIMGGHLSHAQGFDKEVVDAIKEQYLPIGLDSPVPKKPFNVTLSLTDKIDTLVGFFGVNQKPTKVSILSVKDNVTLNGFLGTGESSPMGKYCSLIASTTSLSKPCA